MTNCTYERIWALPLNPVYNLAIRLYLNRYQNASRVIISPLPTICIGNIQVGGTGKTPLVMSILDALHSQNLTPALVARGVGRRTRGLVSRKPGDTSHVTVAMFGDEVTMIATSRPWLPIAISEKRVDAVKELISFKPTPDMVIMDDGFSHLALSRDLNILMIDTTSPPWGFLPAGRLREPVKSVQRAKVFVLNGSNGRYRDAWIAALDRYAPGSPRYCVDMVASGFVNPTDHTTKPLDWFKGKKLLAVSGIGRPGKFEKALLDLDATVIPMRFSDHHDYTDQDWKRILDVATSNGVDSIITTAKDGSKLTPFLHSMSIPVYIMNAMLVYQEGTFNDLLGHVLGAYEMGKQRLLRMTVDGETGV